MEGLIMWIGAFVLLLVIAGAVIYTRGRNRDNDRVTERATREAYKNPDHYDETREKLQKELRKD
jgi:hypothetical protein